MYDFIPVSIALSIPPILLLKQQHFQEAPTFFSAAVSQTLSFSDSLALSLYICVYIYIFIYSNIYINIYMYICVCVYMYL